MMRLSGRARSAMIIGGQGIRSRKLRTLLSMISLFLGVLAVVTVQAGLEIANRALLSDVELTRGRDGTVVMYMPPYEVATPIAMDTVKDRSDAVAMINLEAVVGEPGVTPVNPGGSPFDQPGAFYGGPSSPSQQSQDQGRPTGAAIAVRLVGLSGDIRQFRPFQTDSGEWLDFSGPPELSPRIVLNREAAKGFNRFRVPAEMRMSGAKLNPTPKIVGVVHDADYGPVAYVRADELQNWVSAAELGQMGVSLMLSPTATGVEQTLRARLIAQGVDKDTIYRESINSREQFTDQLGLLRWIFFGMAALVLLIGVAGILNVGLATVGERVEEFALRRAVGMPRLLLAGIVLSETLIIGMLTALAAIGAGVVGLELAGRVLGDREPFLRDVTFPWQAGVAGVIAGLAAGVLGGLIPAIRAARIPIATVMRA
ncbi:MAG TPA: ABC transporter permease [Actinophytocola sp.]|uniref:ABC transporter permease n=1 Tax=Actinophytocola sp. TaxID=1872138 RepID=UPI002DB7EF43|nr:ABC transporter permease [Actinophytocola sp.]HEU5474524.1 ABC transporter permease [Actinophytocola sp.]